ncbi:uncharacterized protein LOC131671555 [Phymastichus coffea]|uniref:uncharacterized protein LOC131671555 n=1 Tax=Phymastichus coffea TaxID=108790 RepID=UPI00273C9438|nr:uncharacterized protein LOC131671555 [Phymastichus coffea]
MCETCIKFFNDQKQLQENTEDDTSLLFNPDRILRYNSMREKFEKLEYLKPNQSALCSVKFTKNLQGKILRVAINTKDPYTHLKENNTVVGGFLGDVWTILEKALKFRSIYTSCNNISELRNGAFDITLAATTLIAQPTVYYVPSTVIGQKSYSLFTVPEGTFISKWWYIRIFHVYVWTLSMLFVLLLTLSMIGIYNIKSKLCTNNESCDEFGCTSFNLLCILGATSGQGFQKIPRSWSLRICTFTALIMGMLLSCGFNSTLTSYLAFRAPFVAVYELEDVWRKMTHSICVRDQTYAYNELQMSIEGNNEPKSVKNKKKLLLNRKCPNMTNEVEFRKNICSPGFLFLETPDIFLKQYQHVQDKCQIIKVRGSYWRAKISFLHYRGSKYWKILNTYLLRLHSTGIIKYLETKWGFHRELPFGIYNNYQEIELDHIKLLILGLFIAIIISIIICIFEHIWFRLHNDIKLSNIH